MLSGSPYDESSVDSRKRRNLFAIQKFVSHRRSHGAGKHTKLLVLKEGSRRDDDALVEDRGKLHVVQTTLSPRRPWRLCRSQPSSRARNGAAAANCFDFSNGWAGKVLF